MENEIKWNEDLGALVNGAGEKFEGTRISGMVGFKSSNSSRGSEKGADASVMTNMLYGGRERDAVAYEIVSHTSRDTASGQEFCQPEWEAHMSAIFYR